MKLIYFVFVEEKAKKIQWKLVSCRDYIVFHSFALVLTRVKVEIPKLLLSISFFFALFSFFFLFNQTAGVAIVRFIVYDEQG